MSEVSERENYLQGELEALITRDKSIFDFLQRGSLDGVWYWDLEFPDNEWMSPRFWEVLGQDPTQKRHLAAEWQNLIHPDDLKTAVKNLQAHCHDPDHPYDQIVRYRHTDGDYAWVRCRGIAIRDADGRAVRMLGAHTDLTSQKRIEEKLLARECDLHATIARLTRANDLLEYAEQVARMGHWRIDLKEQSVIWSKEIYRIHGVTPQTYTPALESAIAFYHPEDRAIVQGAIEDAAQNSKDFAFSLRVIRRDGEIRFVQSRGNPERDATGAVVALFGTFIDLTEQRRAEAAVERLHAQTEAALDKVAASEARYRMLADNTSDMITTVGRDGIRQYVSPSSAIVLGRPPHEIVGTYIGDFALREDLPLVEAGLHCLWHDDGKLSLEYRIYRPDGTLAWIEARGKLEPGAEEVVVTVRDITQRKQVELALHEANHLLEKMSRTDGLTGLANRRAFDEALDREWRNAVRNDTPLSLILLDIDLFKLFNDQYGHQTGDACIREVASAVSATSRRPGDVAARYGGEEMAILMPNTDAEGAAAVADQLRYIIETLAIPHERNSAGVGVVTACFGVATAAALPACLSSRQEDLVETADRMLYQAKREGRNRVVASPFVIQTHLSTPEGVGTEERRLAILAEYDAAGATNRSRFLDRLSKAAASVAGVSIGLVSLVGRDWQSFAGNYGLEDVNGTARSISFCAHTIQGNQVFVVEDAETDCRFAGNPLVTGAPGIRFYAGAPLTRPQDGQMIGALCVIDTKPRSDLSVTQKNALSILASMAMHHIDQTLAAGAS